MACNNVNCLVVQGVIGLLHEGAEEIDKELLDSVAGDESQKDGLNDCENSSHENKIRAELFIQVGNPFQILEKVFRVESAIYVRVPVLQVLLIVHTS